MSFLTCGRSSPQWFTFMVIKTNKNSRILLDIEGVLREIDQCAHQPNNETVYAS